jgi:uncharacterized protein (TIGR02271 family)
MTQTVVALFDTVEAAERAAYDLATRVGGVRGEVYAADRAGDLSTADIPAEDTLILHENMRRGGAVLRAEVPDEKVRAVSDAVEAAGAVDFEERDASWRREGWTGASVTAAGTAGTATGAPLVTGDDTATTATAGSASTAAPVGGTASTAVSGTARQDTGASGGEEVIPVVEERLRVGKREAAHGRVRIRSYVVETPVQEQVTLREERVEVERRPVDRDIAPGDDAFRERVVEAAETAEEAVVAKEARVTEEVVVRKTADERTETVRDTVRRTEVEVEDERGRTGAPEQGRDRT